MPDASAALVLGVPLIVLGCLSSALGFALMKRSGEVESHLPPWLAWRWLLGFVCLAFLQTFCDAASLSMLPLSVVAPFAGLTIVFSLVIAASGVLSDSKEKLSTADVMAAAAVLFGVTCVSLASPPPSSEATLDEASDALLDPIFAVPVLLTLGSAASCLLTTYLNRAGLCASRPSPLLAAIGAASCGALSQFAIKVLSLSVQAMGGAAPSGGLMATLMAWAHPVALLGVGTLCFSAPTQLSLLQTALAARASLVVPLYQASLVSLTTLTGGVAFHEFRAMQSYNIAAYSAGLLVATAGLLTLTKDAGADGEDDDEEEDDEEEAAMARLRAVDGSLVPSADSSSCDLLGATASSEGIRAEHLQAPLLSPHAASPPALTKGMSLDEQFASPWSTPGSAPGSAPGRGGARHANARPPLAFNVPHARNSISTGARRSSRMPAPFLMGIGLAVIETRSVRTHTGRARSVSDGRAISRQRAEMKPMYSRERGTPRGRSASTLT